ncbi:LacI family DNA-binding transcriptional regulator [Cohnella fermenti]|nr:LacI family DNA-binding transcriptional regulator [Cohnella fermenti]
MRVTIKDVARCAGVSIATVSNVLNGTGRVSADTISLVQRAIKALDFSPSQAARNLKAKKSRLIAVIVPFAGRGVLHENPFYWELVTAIEAGARSYQLHVLLVGAEPEESFSFVKERHLDGVIVIGASEGTEALARILQLNVPTVFLDSYLSDAALYQVLVDDEWGGCEGTKHLIGLGHRSIALLTGELRPRGVHEARYIGYRKALDEAGIGYRPNLVIEAPPSMEGGSSAAARIAELIGVTAVFATSDVAAIGLMSGLGERGIAVPRDLSVVGFDDLHLGRFASPPLTTVAQDIGGKGREAVRLLLAQMENGRAPSRLERLKVEMKVRRSARRLE